MTTRIGINGFGRMGRLFLRAGLDRAAIDVARINEVSGGTAVHAHLLEFDSVHGRWNRDIIADASAIAVGGRPIGLSTGPSPAETDWSGIDLVLECSGRFKSEDALAPYFAQGVGTVLVSAPAPRPRSTSWSG